MKEKIDRCVRALVPHPYTVCPNNAVDCALRWLESGGRLFLLSILDNGDLKNLQYRTGWSSESVAIRSLKESYGKLQKGYSEKYVELVNEKAVRNKVKVIPSCVFGDPANEVLKAVKKHSIQKVFIEKLRNTIIATFLGDELEYLCKACPCEVVKITGNGSNFTNETPTTKKRHAPHS